MVVQSIKTIATKVPQYNDPVLNKLIDNAFTTRSKKDQEACIGLASIRLHFLENTKKTA